MRQEHTGFFSVVRGRQQLVDIVQVSSFPAVWAIGPGDGNCRQCVPCCADVLSIHRGERPSCGCQHSVLCQLPGDSEELYHREEKASPCDGLRFIVRCMRSRLASLPLRVSHLCGYGCLLLRGKIGMRGRRDEREDLQGAG